jgi:hypothetical protein
MGPAYLPAFILAHACGARNLSLVWQKMRKGHFLLNQRKISYAKNAQRAFFAKPKKD